ncbi:MAG TPA: hypothetical protein ENK10_01790 [Acidobacteria bacterium]|nr:hypothetical protein [Acidobacteriota bacterium]
MTSQSPPPAGSLDMVTRSFEAGWKRMGALLFGPFDFKSWIFWGLLITLSGLTSFGMSSQWQDRLGNDGFAGRSHLGRFTEWSWGPMVAVMVLFGVFIALVLALTFLYFRSRFRLVFLEAVASGRPRIRGVFGSTGRDGLAYFVYELASWLALAVLALIPVVLIWLPSLRFVMRHGDFSDPPVMQILASLAWIVPLALVKFLLDGFVYDLVLPRAWTSGEGFPAAFGFMARRAGTHLGATILYLLARVLVAIVAGLLIVMLCCLTCCIWALPLGSVAAISFGLALATVAFPPVLVLTLPLLLGVYFLATWAQATVFAPVHVFYRAWSLAFARELDPSIPAWREPDNLTGPRPPAPVPPPPPTGESTEEA